MDALQDFQIFQACLVTFQFQINDILKEKSYNHLDKHL